MQTLESRPWPVDSNGLFDSPWLEEDHFEREYKMFAQPVWIGPGLPSKASRMLEFRSYFRRNINRRLDELIPEDCGPFCWKDFAVYGVGALSSLDKFALLAELYREWFPHRAEPKHAAISQSFLAKFMYFSEPSPSLCEIGRFHDTLCAKLCELEPDAGKKPSQGAILLVAPEQFRKVEYQMRPTFSMAFILIHAGWQERGVQLVWRNAEDAVKYGSYDNQELIQSPSTNKDVYCQDCVVHCSLQRATHLILSAGTD